MRLTVGDEETVLAVMDAIAKTGFGADELAMAYDGGRGASALSHIVDEMFPGNTIPRLFVSNDLVLSCTREWMTGRDGVVTLTPERPVRKNLEREGWPVWNHFVSRSAERAFDGGEAPLSGAWTDTFLMPDYDYERFPISDRCCALNFQLPVKAWMKSHGKKLLLTGGYENDGMLGWRCVRHAVPLLKAGADLDFVNRYRAYYGLEPSPAYSAKNAYATKCIGCPFLKNGLRRQLKWLSRKCPEDYDRAVAIWGPILSYYEANGIITKYHLNCCRGYIKPL